MDFLLPIILFYVQFSAGFGFFEYGFIGKSASISFFMPQDSTIPLHSIRVGVKCVSDTESNTILEVFIENNRPLPAVYKILSYKDRSSYYYSNNDVLFTLSMLKEEDFQCIFECTVTRGTMRQDSAKVTLLKGVLPNVIQPTAFTTHHINLGSIGNFDCEGYGAPTPMVHWMRSTDGGKDEEMRSDLGKAVLSIRYAKMADSGTYYCYAENLGGVSENRSLTLYVVHIEYTGPKFKKVTSQIGDNVFLVCPIGDGSPPGINNTDLPSRNKLDYLWLAPDGHNKATAQNFTLSNIQADEFGSYTCIASNQFGTPLTSTTVVAQIKYCAAETSRGIDWGVTETNVTAILPCPTGSNGNATRECTTDILTGKVVWMKANLGGCVSEELVAIMNSKKTDVIVVANDVQSFVTKEQALYGGDLENVVDIMENITLGNITEKTEEPEKFSEIMVNITSTLLDKSTIEAWNDLTPSKKSKQVEKLLTTSESVIDISAKNMPQNKTTKTIITENIVMRLQKLSTKDIMNDSVITVTADQSIKLPGNALKNAGDEVYVVVVTYEGLSELMGVPEKTSVGKSSSENLTINSNILSISIFPQKMKYFESPVVMVQELIEPPANGTEPNCVYWQFDSNDDSEGGYWSNEGCLVHHHNNSHVTCHCYHLTNFAVLMSLTDAADKLTGDHKLALNLISLIGISISLVALLASFLTFILVKMIHSLRNTIHQHLVVALFIAEALFIFGIDKTQNKIACPVIAASLHYFFLVAFFIMSLEGIVLYLKLVRVFTSMGTDGYGNTKYILICWILPIVFIAINVSIDRKSYGYNRDFCWLSIKDGFIWSFVGPVLLVLVFNFIILFKILHIMSIKAKKRSSSSDEIWYWMKGCCILLSILGTTWVLGIFYVEKKTLFAAYLFNIINSLQGLSIFIFHCLCDPRVRTAYYNFFCCVRHRSTLLCSQPRKRTKTATGPKISLKKKSENSKRYIINAGKEEDTPLYGDGADSSSNRSTPTSENDLGVLVGMNKF